MAISNVKSKEIMEKIKKQYKRMMLVFNVLSVIVMLIHPIVSILNEKGNLYINIGVLVVSFIYGVLSIIFGSKKAYNMNRVYKWCRLILSLVSLSINAYSIYITATNFNLVSVLISIAMGLFWFLNFIYNLLYDIISYKIRKYVEQNKENFNEVKDKIIKLKDNYKNKKLVNNKLPDNPNSNNNY